MESLLNALSIAVEVEPATDVKRALFDGLFQSNVERTGGGRIEQLCVVARDSDDALMGGIYGEVYWGWLNILAIWVTPRLRQRGLGTQLLARAEGEASAKVCHGGSVKLLRVLVKWVDEQPSLALPWLPVSA